MSTSRPPLVDPDPFSVVAVWIAGASLILQFVQFLTDHTEKTSESAKREFGGVAALTSLETTIEELEQTLNGAARAIERGSNDPDREFYDAPVGVGLSVMRLDATQHDAFARQLAEAYTKAGAVGMWTAQLLRNSPGTSAILGDRLASELGDAKGRINSLVRSGATNKALIAETRLVLDACRIAVGAMLNERRRN